MLSVDLRFAAGAEVTTINTAKAANWMCLIFNYSSYHNDTGLASCVPDSSMKAS